MTKDFERLKYFRKTVLKKTQSQFSSETGIGRSALASYETGVTRIPDVLIKLMVEKYLLNEAWLKHGIGEPLQVPDAMQAVTKADIIKNERLQAEIKILLKEKDRLDQKIDELDKTLDRLDKKERDTLLDSFLKIARLKTT